MDDLTRMIFLWTALPGVIAGLIWSIRDGLVPMVISCILGTIGSFFGALGTGGLLNLLKLEGKIPGAIATASLFAGAMLGAFILLFLVSRARRLMTG